MEPASPDQMTQLNTFVNNPLFGVITNPAGSLSSATVVHNPLLKPYPQCSGFSGNYRR